MKSKFFLIILIFLFLGVVVGRLIATPKKDSSTGNIESASKRATGWASPREVSSAKFSSGRSSHRFRAMMDKWGKGQLPEDWNAELKKIFELPQEEGFEREKALFLFFAKWAETDFDEAMRMAGKTGKIAEELKKELFIRYASKDPKAALAYYGKNKEACDKYDYCLKEIARNWGIKSPAEAYDWCGSFEMLTQKNAGTIKFSKFQALDSFMKGVFQSNDPSLIIKYMDKIRSDNGYIPNLIIRNWAGVNPEQAMDWVVSQADDKGNQYISDAIEGMVDTNLKMAEELLATLNQNKRVSMVSNIARKIQYSQGEEASLNWAMKQMPLSDFNEFTFMPLSNWSHSNPDAAAQWVQDLPSSSGKDLATISYAKGVFGGQSNSEVYEAAMELVKNMSDVEKKESTLKEMSEEWQKKDPDGYKKWEEKSNQPR